MPKLPDYTALGPLQQPDPSGRVPAYSPQGFNYTGTRGGEYFGRALKEIGGELEKYGTQEKTKADTLQQAQADAEFSIARTAAINEAARNPDYEAAPGQYQGASQAALQSARQRIRDPQKQLIFEARHSPQIASDAQYFENLKFKRQGEAVVGEINLLADALHKDALSATDPAEANQKIVEIRNLYAGAVVSGHLTPKQADDAGRKRSEQFAQDWVNLQTPEKRVELLRQMLPNAPQRGPLMPPPERSPSDPAAIRYNNPGAQWPAKESPNYGMTGYGVIGGNNKIAQFPTPEQGAAANMDLLSRRYVGMTIGAAAQKWSNSGYSSVEGFDPKMVITKDMVRDPEFAIPFFKSISRVEAGKPYPMTDAQWQTAHDMFLAGGAPGNGVIPPAATATAGETAPAPRDYGDLKLPYNVPGLASGMALSRVKAAGVFDDLPKPLQTKLAAGGGYEISKADLDAVPDAVWRKVAPLVGAPVPPEPKAADPKPEHVAQAQSQRTGTPADIIPAHRLPAMFRQAERDLAVANNKRSAELSKSREDQFDRVIIDANAGIGELPDRSVIENDPALSEGHRNVLLRKYDASAKHVDKTKIAMQWFTSPDGPALNPYDKSQREVAELAYQALGATDAALQAVIDKGQVLPESVGVGLRGALVSNNPVKVQGALTAASNLQARVPNIFTHVEGAKDITDAVVAYRHDIEDLGFTAPEAAARYSESKSPEYQTKLKARIKGEDLNEIVKKQVSVSDIQSAFKQSPIPFFGKPAVGLDPKSRRSMLGDFEEVFRERYLENGNVDLSKRLAADQLKKTWGVTKLNGSDVVMKFPPEMAPAYRNVPNAAGLIADQAVKDIKEETGQTVERGQLRFMPVPGGRTSTAYWNGDPPPYTVGWQDKNGVVHFAPRPFVADLKAAIPAQTEQRGQYFQKAREAQQQTDALTAPKPPGQRRTGRPTMENFPPAPDESPLGSELKLPE